MMPLKKPPVPADECHVTTYQGRKAGDVDYGLGEHSLDADRLGIVDETELTERLIRTFSHPDYHPPRLPVVATELLALSQQPDVEFPAIESLLEQDAMLAGEVLRVARSAFYSGVRPVTTLQGALVRLGLTKLREIVLEVALNLRVFRSATYQGCMERLRKHSQTTANLCRVLSRYAPVTQDRAFLCGLLHDVGIAGILLMLGDAGRGEKTPDLAAVWPAIHGAHGRAGARMVELWNLPPEIATAVAAHHEISVDGEDNPAAATVCLAEEYAVRWDRGLIPLSGSGDHKDLEESGLIAHGAVDRTDAAILDRARKALDLTDSMTERLEADVRAWIASDGE